MIGLAGCREKTSQKINDIANLSFSRGYVDGANAIIQMLNDGNYSQERVRLQQFKDSVDFANLIDK